MTVERHLVLVHQPERQSLQDFYDIAALVEEMAPDIRVYVVYNTARNALTRKKAAGLPTLVFSPGELDEFTPARGKTYAGQFIPKSQQMRRLAEAGLPVPQSIGAGGDLSALQQLNELVLVKQDDENASRGMGIQLRRRSDLEAEIATKQLNRLPQLVQSYIDTGPFPVSYRVHTLFGETLLAYKKTSTQSGPRASETDLAKTPFQPRRSTGQTTNICREDDVLVLAKHVYDVFPEIPLHGCDLVRDHVSGQLFVLEINAGGNTWVFSKRSPTGRTTDAVALALGVSSLIEPFDAFRTAARVLIEKTRAEAE